MRCRKQLLLTGYRVQYVDLRQPKPRTIREEPYLLDKCGMDALAAMGLNVTDYITARYECGGYHVLGIERVTARRTVSLDLRQLWEQATAQHIEH